MTTSDSWMVPIPVRRVVESPDNPAPRNQWPATIPAIRQVLDEGLEFGPSTVLVGANGVGKSTLVEAIAMAFGMSGEGGGTGAMHATTASESNLNTRLQLQRGPGGSRWGYFLRAETMHGLFNYLGSNGPEGYIYHRLSHGESFIEFLQDSSRFARGGLMIMDEPEAGLSFESQLALLAQLMEFADHPQGQVIIATHSPVIAALPGARLLELSSTGIAETSWHDLSVVDHYHRFTSAPEAYLRHLR